MDISWHTTLPEALAVAWDAAWAAADAHPFQHRQLAALRARSHGQDLRYLVVQSAGQVVAGAAVQIRPSGPWPCRLAVTRGPFATDETALLAALRALTSPPPCPRRPMAVRVDPHCPQPAANVSRQLVALGFIPTAPELHQQTVVVDLSRSETDILAGCRTLTRRQLKKATSMGLTSRLGTEADVPAYLAIHLQAASAKGYGVPDGRWLKELLASGQGTVILTEIGGRLVGGAWFAHGQRTTHYLYGATAADFEGPALYQAFWTHFGEARAHGLTRADLGGLPHVDDGVAFFKRGFGGDEVGFIEEHERPLRPWPWASWQLAKRVAVRG